MKNKTRIILPLLFSLAFTAGMLLYFPFRYRFEFYTDEGINLIKAMMSLKGFELYSEVWSDQPPVFNLILTLWFRLLGMKANAGRILVLGFSSLLLFSATRYLQRLWGIPHAILGVIAIVTLPFYTTLSVSVMIGLPSIAIALLSFAGLTSWHQNKRDSWLFFSAALLGLSVMTKIWTVILVPIFLVGIFLDKAGSITDRSELWDRLRPIAIWSLGFLLVSGIIALLVIRPGYLPQLVGVHLSASETEAMQANAARNTLNSYLNDSIPLFFLSLFGAGIAVRARSWHALYLVAWMLAGYLLLLWIVPNWHHHQLLVTIPAAVLGAIAMGSAVVELVTRLRSSRLWTLKFTPSAVILLLSVFFAYQRIPLTLKNFNIHLPNFGTYEPADEADFEIIAIMQKYADRTHYLYTDRPIYAFRSGIEVHPYLAVITEKRVVAGDLSQEDIYSVLLETKPEQVIISRFNFPAVKEYMETRNFIRVDSSPRSRHFVKGEIYDNP